MAHLSLLKFAYFDALVPSMVNKIKQVAERATITHPSPRMPGRSNVVLTICESTNFNLISTSTAHSKISAFKFLMQIVCIKVNFNSAKMNIHLENVSYV